MRRQEREVDVVAAIDRKVINLRWSDGCRDVGFRCLDDRRLTRNRYGRSGRLQRKLGVVLSGDSQSQYEVLTYELGESCGFHRQRVRAGREADDLVLTFSIGGGASLSPCGGICDRHLRASDGQPLRIGDCPGKINGVDLRHRRLRQNREHQTKHDHGKEAGKKTYVAKTHGYTSPDQF